MRKKLGQRVGELRGRAGLSQRALAARAGIDRSFLSEIESGRRSPTVDTLSILVRALGVELAELFVLDAGDETS